MININLKIIGKVLYGLILVVLILVAGVTAFSALNIPGSYKLMVVQSGSMEPAIKTGSIVVVKPENDYQKGDVITFKDPEKGKTSITHRIYEVKNDSGKVSYVTKGDANNTADMKEINKSQVLGKLLVAIPFLGYPVNFAKTREGLIFLIVIPAVIIVYSEILNIKKEALRLIKERKNRKLTLKEKVEEKVGEEIINIEKKIKNTSK